MSLRAASWIAALAVALGVFVYGATAESPPRTNADVAHELAQEFACPVCAGQSIAESDVPVAREIRRLIAVWVDEGRSDAYIRDQLVAAYGDDIDYRPSSSGVTSLVWILPVVAVAAIATVLVVTLRGFASSAQPAVGDGSAVRVRDRPPASLSSDETLQRGDQRRRPPAADAAHSATVGYLRRQSWRRAVVWIVAVLVAAGAAGVLVARFSGSRTSDGSITGEIRTTTREQIFEAQQQLASGDLDTAIATYDEVLALQPSNVESLTYRGWLTSRNGDLITAAVYLDDAIAVDPDYPDARLFRAIVALDSDDGLRASAELAAFDALDPPPFAEELLARAQVRERVAAAAGEAALAAIAGTYFADDRPAFGVTELTVTDAAAAAGALAAQGEMLEALQVLDWVLESRPDDPAVLAERGWLLVRTGDPELMTRGLTHLDAALAIDPVNLNALLYRALTYLEQGDREAARADLAAFDALDDQPPELLALLRSSNLRAALDPSS